ncbi:MAG: hypothetical protein Q9162_001286 [Coniocarpon cinnabarinum]
MVAAQDMKLNYKKIADMYGEGATYDAIEGRFRIIRKEAVKMKTELDHGDRQPAPPRGSGPARSPRKNRRQPSVIDLDAVETGRITKPSSTQNTPTKRRTTAAAAAAAHIKKEALEASTSTSSSGEATVPSDGDGDEAYMPAQMSTSSIFDPMLFSNGFDDPNLSMTTEGMDMSFIDESGEQLEYV